MLKKSMILITALCLAGNNAKAGFFDALPWLLGTTLAGATAWELYPKSQQSVKVVSNGKNTFTVNKKGYLHIDKESNISYSINHNDYNDFDVKNGDNTSITISNGSIVIDKKSGYTLKETPKPKWWIGYTKKLGCSLCALTGAYLLCKTIKKFE